MSTVLDLTDQVHFLGEQATGTSIVLQCVWVYDTTIDLEGLRRFHHHLQRGRLARRIDPSPLPFGRHRWVAADRTPDLHVAQPPRPRGEFDAWLDEQAELPLDAEQGPGWRLAVLPFAEGGAGVTLVISHCLTDGVGLCEALADAASGRGDAITWPAAPGRRRWPTVRRDLRQTASDLPDIGRAVAAAVRALGSAPRAAAPARTARRELPSGRGRAATLSTATVLVDATHWDMRAQALGGTSNTMLAAVAARLAVRLGRVGADGSALLAMPVNNRLPGDTRANALTGIEISVDPRAVLTDLRDVRAATKRALIHRRDVPDERFALLPLTPLLPKWLVRRMIGMAVGEAVTGSSNLGAVNPAALRPDGTEADSFAMKMRYPRMTEATMRHTRGLLSLLSGRTSDTVFVSVVVHQPVGAEQSLPQLISSALADLSLTTTTQRRTPERLAAARGRP